MKCTIRKALTLFFACCLIVSMCCGVSASGTGGRSQQLPDPDLGGGGTRLYTLNANNLTGLISTSKFEKGNLPANTTKITVYGHLTHTASAGLTTPTIRAGLGFVASGTTTIVPDIYKNYSGNTITVDRDISVSNLSSHGRYCVFINNLSPNYGTVSGSLAVYAVK